MLLIVTTVKILFCIVTLQTHPQNENMSITKIFYVSFFFLLLHKIFVLIYQIDFMTH